VYVDPVVPPFSLRGDVIKLPLQVVNTTEKPVALQLRVQVEGAQSSLASVAVNVPAASTKVEYTTLTVAAPGQVILKVTAGRHRLGHARHPGASGRTADHQDAGGHPWRRPGSFRWKARPMRPLTAIAFGCGFIRERWRSCAAS